MAQIIISSHEIISILRANELIPPQILDLRMDGEEIRFRVRTEWPILKSVRVGMRFAGFEDGCMVFQLATNRLTDRLDWLVDKMLEPLQLENLGGRWEYPRLYVDVNKLIRRQLRGVAIDDVTFQDGHFHVTTHADAMPPTATT
jgi:hypothetical protein